MNKTLLLLFILSNLLIAQETGARYLIITHDDYYDAIKPLADWKTQKGFKTKIVKTSETGSDSSEIRAYVAHAYNTWQTKPEYLLLVGNKWQIPFPRIVYNYIGVSTDNYYTDVTGDSFNDIIPGRFWVYDTLQAQTMVAKVLGYEKNPYLEDTLWFRKGVTIANENEDGQPPSDSVYWADARYAHDLMNQAGFVHIDSFSYYYGHNSQDVIDAINDGRSYILYRGVGFGMWNYPFWDIWPEQMNNGFKLPIVISATCGTIEGIGYEWTASAGTPSEPKGPVGFYGTTTALSQAAEMRSALAKGTLESIFTDSLSTLGRAAEAGRLKYYELFGDLLEYYSWNCLGDPEMTVWTTTPRAIEVTHNPLLFTGPCTVSVNVRYDAAPVESALVCVMARQSALFYHYGWTDNSGTFEFVDTLNYVGDSVFFTVTGRNLKTYNGLRMVHFGGGPYVILNSFSTLDTTGGNGDHIVNPGEDIEIPACVKNWGNSTAYSVLGIIQQRNPDPYVTTVHDTMKYFGDIPSLDSAYTSDDGYNVIIAENCPDLHEIELQLVICDLDTTVWTSDFSIITHAPNILLNDYYFSEYSKSTPAGDTSQLTVELKNIGSYYAEDVTGKILCDDAYLTIIDSICSFGTIPSNSVHSNQSNPFIVCSNPETPPCTPILLKLEVTSGVYNDTIGITIYVGQKDFLVWDPDRNHSSGPIIKANLDALNFLGDYKNRYPDGLLSLYKSVFICTGVYPNNYIIRDMSSAAYEIERYLTLQGGKVYLEGGDVWYGDPQSNHGYQFCPLFGINAMSNTTGLFPGVTGKYGTFTQDMLFTYEGESTILDYIERTGGAVVIFRNTHNDHGCGVANNNRTVGLAFEFGGLVDTTAPSTKRVLADSIMAYFGIPPIGITEQSTYQNFPTTFLAILPNPARGKVTIKYGLAKPTLDGVTIKIYDVTGRLVKQFNHQLRNPNAKDGELPNQDLLNQIVWRGVDENGCKVPQGIYLVRIETENFVKTEKVIFLR